MIKDFNLDALSDYFNAESRLKYEASKQSKHFKLKVNKWGFTLWDKEVRGSLRPLHIIDDNEQLLREWGKDLLNNTNKSHIPLKFEAPLNVILLIGIRESIDRDIGASTTTLNWASVGNSSTAELETQTDLQAEFTDTTYARRVFSTGGQRQRINQTAKLGMLWDDTSFDATPRTIKEAGIHWHISDASKCHARVVSTDFVLNAGDLFVSQISELQENGTL